MAQAHRSSAYDDRDRDGSMYDDRYSRSRSVERGHYGDHAPRGPAASHRRPDYSEDRDYRAGRDDYRRSSPSHRGGGRGYRDRDREGYRSPEYGNSRSRSPSRSRSRGRGRDRDRHRQNVQESREVIMEGLPVDMVEEDISNELLEYYHVQGLEDVRVIRDRQTKISRQIGFLRFYSLNDSRNFMGQNAPTIYLSGRNPGNDDHGAKVRISFTRERDDRRGRPEGEWTCRNCSFDNFSTRHKCFRCQADRAEAEMTPDELPARPSNIGDNDVAPDNTPSQFLLFRGLDTAVTEEVFSKGVTKLYKPTVDDKQNPETAPKKAKVASTTGDSNLGAREGSLRRVLLVRDRRSNESWKFGFAEFATIEDAQAALAKLNSFEKFTIASKPVLASYIHAGVFVPVLNPTPSTARFTFCPLNNPAMKLAYWDEDGYVTELVVSTEDLDKKPKTDSKAPKESDKARKRKAEASSSVGVKKMAVPSHLQFWSNRHAELHGIQKKDDEGQEAGKESEKESAAVTAAPPSRSYADLNRNCCYLCMRQFKSSAEVNRHERLSQLHRDNLNKEELVTKALAKLEKHKDDQPTTEYRDRAKERRQAFGSTRQTQAKVKPAAPAKRDDEEPAVVPAPSKGAALLSKMGWSEGSGLGAQGTGMTAPIATDVYAQGVGLGAQGSKLGEASEEAARNTRGRYDEFLEKTKDLARERYERMP
ncbi:G-patch domain protein, putative [Talaromyces stipitatus ATCC 10500]|uniref:G-patch domain protein, putative n=1 Tax=Talaromyces stipitatus (strain ATCC 10500 / CBS 375.48 / QM 6759 / NRRL 1006) TaxID=441959 RepID=B8MME4_TALSN|nr:G-patch domain protein, putative [Talaromyces stipitatus ATCC 10500]EED13698.1 G-patch domain protein, putative [Talaromyces stipitatus ATCC 10500]